MRGFLAQAFQVKPIQRIIKELKDHTYSSSPNPTPSSTPSALPIHNPALRKTLSRASLVFYGLGTTLGVGVFVLTGEAIHSLAGPSAVLSYIFAGLACSFSALCYADLAARVPASGSAYTYAYASLGELLAWVIGWDLTLEYAISAAAIARGWSTYFQKFLVLVGVPHEVLPPEWIFLYKVGDVELSIAAGALVLFCSLIVILGIEESAFVNNCITVLNITAIIFFVISGGMHVSVSNWSDFFPFGVSGTLKASGFLFFAFIGFDQVSCLAEECQNPQRDLPFGILITLFIATVLYSSVAFVLAGLLVYTEISSTAPLAETFEFLGLKWQALIIAACAVTTTVSTTLCSLMGQPRIYYRMSRDGLLPKSFSRIHPRFRTPILSCIATSTIAFALAVTLDLAALSNMISIGTLLGFTVVCASVLILRFRGESFSSESSLSQAPKSMFASPSFAIFTVFVGSIIMSALVRIQAWFYLPIPVAILIASFARLRILDVPQAGPKNASFTCPLFPEVPCIGIVLNMILLGTLDGYAWLRFLVWLSIGLAIYVLYGFKHSSLRKSPVVQIRNSENVMANGMGLLSDSDELREELLVENDGVDDVLSNHIEAKANGAD